MRKKEIRLYNLLFPIWMFFIWPSVLWLILLPANFVIDSVVLLLTMYALRLENRISLWKKKHCSDLADWLSQRFHRCGAYLCSDACFGLAESAI